MEHPASLHSKPASLNILSKPFCSAIDLTKVDPGTTIAFTFELTFLFLTI